MSALNNLETLGRKALIDVMLELSQQQVEALQHATFVTSTPEQAAQYDRRQKRITVLREMLTASGKR